MISEFRLAVVLLTAGSIVVKFTALAQLSPFEQSFIDYNLIPDVISVAPKYEAVVSYPSGVRVHLGNELTPTQVKNIPTVEYNATSENFYTLALVEPDGTSRVKPVFRQWDHWLVGNIPGNNVTLGDTLSEFLGSSPPNGTGLHRYVFLVYQQPQFLTFDEPRIRNNTIVNRANFSIAHFAEKYSLGDPVAGNFYVAQYDDIVPLLFERLGVDLSTVTDYINRFWF